MPVPPETFIPRDAPLFRRRIAVVIVLVLAGHIGLLCIALSAADRPVERPVASRVITARLISAPAEPAAKDVAVQSPALPKATVPARRRADIRPAPHSISSHPAAVASPVRATVSSVPSPVAASTPDSPGATPTASAPASIAAFTPPAPGRETLAIGVPKNVAHLDCQIAKPAYPDESKQAGESGTVIVRFVVDATGNIGEVQIKRSSGYPRLDQAALDAVHASACRPYEEQGEPLRAAGAQPFAFRLAK